MSRTADIYRNLSPMHLGGFAVVVEHRSCESPPVKAIATDRRTGERLIGLGWTETEAIAALRQRIGVPDWPAPVKFSGAAAGLVMNMPRRKERQDDGDDR